MKDLHVDIEELKKAQSAEARDLAQALAAGCGLADAIGSGQVKPGARELSALAIVLLTAAVRWVIAVEERAAGPGLHIRELKRLRQLEVPAIALVEEGVSEERLAALVRGFDCIDCGRPRPECTCRDASDATVTSFIGKRAKEGGKR